METPRNSPPCAWILILPVRFLGSSAYLTTSCKNNYRKIPKSPKIPTWPCCRSLWWP